jgi:hypothetical protein
MGFAKSFAGVLACLVAGALLGSPAEAAPKKKVVYVRSHVRQATVVRPRTRIRVQARSFLDPGTEVLPGERKFMDYALPPNYSPTQVIDNTAFSHRSPLPGPFDLPGRQNPYPYQW